MTTKGNKYKINKVSGVTGLLYGSQDAINTYGRILDKGVPIYNTDTREFKIGDGETAISALKDHVHKAYAPVVHSHLFGTNIPWHQANPKLWYRDDLVNHPELIALDGSELTDEEAEGLSTVYPGSKLLTETVRNLTANGYENNFVSMKVDVSTGDYFGANLFNDEIDLTNFSKSTDQWLTGSTDLSTEHSVTITFKGGYVYRPTEYWMIPAAGTATQLYATRPTPKDWVLEGSVNGSAWVKIDERTNYTDWEPFSVRTFKISSLEEYSYLRLRITAWNAGDDLTEDFAETESLFTGLRRLWIFGRKPNTFSVPNIPSPSDEFVWVVPKKALNTGLKHEDVGDIGYTALPQDKLPLYRLPADGTAHKISEYELLYSAIGHEHDPEIPYEATTSTGTVDTSWDMGTDDYSIAGYVTFQTGETMVSGYTWDATGYASPNTWTLEAKTDSDTDWTTLQSFTDVSAEDFQATNGVFSLDTITEEKNYTQYRLNVVEWNIDNDSFGYAKFTLHGHPANNFYVPRVESPGLTAYIVARNTADDVSADVIQRLQQNIVDLSNALTSLQNQVNNLDTSIKKDPTGDQ